MLLPDVGFVDLFQVLGGGHGNHAGSMGKEKMMEAMKGHSVVSIAVSTLSSVPSFSKITMSFLAPKDNCWKRENGIDIHHVCDVKTLKMYGMDAEPGVNATCFVAYYRVR